jgi:hypothetical protein
MADNNSGETPAQKYLDSSLRQFHKLAVSGGIVTRNFLLAGKTIRLEVSAGAMARAILPALSHLAESEATKPDLTICAWDSESTGAPGLSPGWGLESYRREGYISGFNDARFHTAMQSDPIILRMIDMAQGLALYWTPTASRIPYWEMGAPLRPLLHEWLKRTGFVAVHGGAVGWANGGLFLAGAGGRGKSNVALACLNSELRYASDDFCFLSRSSPWTVHSLYCTGKIAAGDLVRHPHLRDSVSNPDRLDLEKALFYLNEQFGERLILEMPLLAVVLPRLVKEGPARIIAVSPDVAHRELALSTIELSRWTGRDTLIGVAELLRDLPCYELQIGASIADTPIALAGLLTQLRGSPPPSAPRRYGARH